MKKATAERGLLFFVLLSSIHSPQSCYTDKLFCNAPYLKLKMKQTLQNLWTKFQVTIDYIFKNNISQ